MAVENGCVFDLDALPESVLANALSLTTPKDACRLSLVASSFSSAAQSDAVWERFLPPNYRDVISRSADASDLLKCSSKKELYFRICDYPVIIDDGTKSFSLEKKSGKICYMLGARSLHIVWGDTPEYWQWISMPESRFPEVAELLDVCWLEINAKINSTMLSPDTNYVAYLVFALEERVYGLERQPCEASVGIKGHEAKKRTVYLNTLEELWQCHPLLPKRLTLVNRHIILRKRERDINGILDPNTRYPKERSDKWREVELGDFFVKSGQDDVIEISFMQLKSQWKSGLLIEGIEIRAKEDNT